MFIKVLREKFFWLRVIGKCFVIFLVEFGFEIKCRILLGLRFRREEGLEVGVVISLGYI